MSAITALARSFRLAGDKALEPLSILSFSIQPVINNLNRLIGAKYLGLPFSVNTRYKPPGTRWLAIPFRQFCDRLRIASNDYFALGAQRFFRLGPAMPQLAHRNRFHTAKLYMYNLRSRIGRPEIAPHIKLWIFVPFPLPSDHGRNAFTRNETPGGLGKVSKSFTDLGEREVLALAISLEDEDSRIYRDYAERMKEKYPENASILQSMSEVETTHKQRLTELFQGRFGDHIPYLRRQDIKGFIKRKPIWLNVSLKPKRVRQDVMGMEADSRRFYQQAADHVKSPEVRVLLQELALAEEDHQDILVEDVRKKKKSGTLEKEERS